MGSVSPWCGTALCHLHPPHPMPTEMMLSESPLPCCAPPVQHLCPSLGAIPRDAEGLIINNSNQEAALLLSSDA